MTKYFSPVRWSLRFIDLNKKIWSTFLFGLVLSFFPQESFAADDDILIGWSEEGYQFKMQVISEEAKTARLYGYYKTNYGGIPCIDENISGVITIPAQSEGYKIVAVGTDAFAGCSKLTEVKLPEGILTFGFDAFAACYALEKIRIPSTVTDLYDEGWNIFKNCRSLKIMEVAEGNQFYDSRNNCNAIIKKAGNVLVAGCANTVIPEDVEEIGSHAFCGQTALTEIYIPHSVKTLGENAFISTSLTSINLSGVKTIGWGVFQNCRELTDVSLGDELESIGEIAFYACPIKKINFPNTLRSIGNRAFQSCTAIEEVVFPRSLTYLGAEAFSYCEGLKEIIIPSTLDTIRGQTFEYCKNVERVTIGKNVSFIGTGAFSGCDNLTEIVSYIKEPFEIDKYTFLSRYGGYANTYEKALLLVPRGTRNLYVATASWNEFLRMKEFDPTASVSISTSAEGLGSMAVAGIYEVGSDITLSASAEEGWVFCGWFVENDMVANDIEYTFTVNEDMMIVAKFERAASVINETRSENAVPKTYYSIDGKELNTPKVGVNIVRMSDGSTKKVFKR